jgi:hypothetical protein
MIFPKGLCSEKRVAAGIAVLFARHLVIVLARTPRRA